MSVLADVVIRPFQLEDAEQMLVLEAKYRALYPDQAKSWLLGYRYNPVFREPGNNFSVFDESGRMIAYFHVHPLLQEDDEPQEVPHRLFLYVNVDVDFGGKDELRELIYQKLLVRCAELARSYGDRRTVRLSVQQYTTETEILEFFRGKGFVLDKSYYEMQRDLAEPIEEVALPEGIVVRKWEFQSQADRVKYLEAANSVFINEHTDLERLAFLEGAVLFTTFTAFDGDAIAGSVLANRIPWKETAGQVDAVFAMPAYRGKGVARALLGAALEYLRGHGMSAAELCVESENVAAIRVYQSMGYRIVKEEPVLGLDM